MSEARPFYKNPLFWLVVGLLVVGIILTLVFTGVFSKAKEITTPDVTVPLIKGISVSTRTVGDSQSGIDRYTYVENYTPEKDNSAFEIEIDIIWLDDDEVENLRSRMASVNVERLFVKYVYSDGDTVISTSEVPIKSDYYLYKNNGSATNNEENSDNSLQIKNDVNNIGIDLPDKIIISKIKNDNNTLLNSNLVFGYKIFGSDNLLPLIGDDNSGVSIGMTEQKLSDTIEANGEPVNLILYDPSASLEGDSVTITPNTRLGFISLGGTYDITGDNLLVSSVDASNNPKIIHRRSVSPITDSRDPVSTGSDGGYDRLLSLVPATINGNIRLFNVKNENYSIVTTPIGDELFEAQAYGLKILETSPDEYKMLANGFLIKATDGTVYGVDAISSVNNADASPALINTNIFKTDAGSLSKNNLQKHLYALPHCINTGDTLPQWEGDTRDNPSDIDNATLSGYTIGFIIYSDGKLEPITHTLDKHVRAKYKTSSNYFNYVILPSSVIIHDGTEKSHVDFYGATEAGNDFNMSYEAACINIGSAYNKMNHITSVTKSSHQDKLHRSIIAAGLNKFIYYKITGVKNTAITNLVKYRIDVHD